MTEEQYELLIDAMCLACRSYYAAEINSAESARSMDAFHKLRRIVLIEHREAVE